ncbi:hypothetical protein H1R20_g14534, partial [Candolleomyces eurysporus]
MDSCATTNSNPFIGFNGSSAITGENIILPLNVVTDIANVTWPLHYELGEELLGPILNFAQLTRAAAHIDLGNPAANNFLLNPQIVDNILVSSFTETPITSASQSRLYSAWKSQMNPTIRSPYPKLNVPGPSTLQAVFICRFFRLKGIGSLIVSVLVATLSMFSSAWALLLAVAAHVVKKGDKEVALVGYDPTTVFHANFNITQEFWFDRFIPFIAQTPGTLCDAHVFNVGESLVTNVSLFEWKVEGVYRPNAGGSGFSYRGETLDNCDIQQVALNGDIRTWTLDGSMWLYCNSSSSEGNGQSLELAGVASFGVSALPARQTNFQRMTRSPAQDSLAITIERLFALAAVDIGARVYEAYVRTPNDTALVSYSLFARYPFCPASLGTTNPCAFDPPAVDIAVSTAILADNTIQPPAAVLPHNYNRISDHTILYNMTDISPVINFLQLARAAALIDLGNPAPNNFLLNLQFTDNVLAPRFPETPVTFASQSRLYSAWKSQTDPADNSSYPVLRVPGPSTLQAVFNCHLFKLKGPGSLFVSVLVATLSMFSSAWGLALIFAAYFVKKRDGDSANQCQGHVRAQTGLEKEKEDDSMLPRSSIDYGT